MWLARSPGGRRYRDEIDEVLAQPAGSTVAAAGGRGGVGPR
jgi:hypothetical protein